MKKTLLIIAMVALVSAAAFAANLVPFGDMETGTTKDWVEEDATLKIEAGKGVDGSKGMKVKCAETWSGIAINVTSFFDRTKSYYIEAWFKLNKAEKDATFGISIEFHPVKLRDYAEEWESNCYVSPGEDPFYTVKETTGMDVPADGTNWVKVSGIIRPEDMETLIDNHGAEITCDIDKVTIYFKIDDKHTKGRIFYLDNVYIEEIPNE